MSILAFAGSTRENSFNKKLAKNAMTDDMQFIDLKDYPLPLYDEDSEEQEGLPENALKLKKMFIEAKGFLISSPEYNSGMSGVLKNTIDWISRPVEGEKSLEAFEGKVCSIMSASPGALGGLRGLVHLRYVLSNIKLIVLPDQTTISQAHEAFDENGILKDEKLKGRVKAQSKKLKEVIDKLC